MCCILVVFDVLELTLTTVSLIDAKSDIKNHLHGIKAQVHNAVVIQGCMCTLVSHGIHEQVASFIPGHDKRFYPIAPNCLWGAHPPIHWL
jgi:hypothetical protein